LDGSRTIVTGNRIIEAHDDGVDVSNEGFAYLIHNQISGITENGVLASNGAQVLLEGVQISKSQAGLTARDGGWALGRHVEISNNRTGVLLFQQIPCALTKSDYQRVKAQIQAMPLDQIKKQQELRVVRKAEDQASSTAVGDLLDDLMKVFKLTDIFGTEYVTTAETAIDPVCQALKTRVSLVDSSVTANQRDLAAYHGYELEFTTTAFTDADTAREVGAKVRRFSQSLAIDTNASTLEANAKRVTQALATLEVRLPTANPRGRER
jgi:hypothetical protein